MHGAGTNAAHPANVEALQGECKIWRIGTHNISTAKGKWDDLCRKAKLENLDVLCMQEARIGQANHGAFARKAKSYGYKVHFGDEQIRGDAKGLVNGLLTLYKQGARLKVPEVNGRQATAVRVQVKNGKPVTIINVHIPKEWDEECRNEVVDSLTDI